MKSEIKCKECQDTKCTYRGPIGDPPDECEACMDQEPDLLLELIDELESTPDVTRSDFKARAKKARASWPEGFDESVLCGEGE